MAYRTVAEVKAYAAQMLSQHEDDLVLAGSTAEDLHNLIERWLTSSFDRIATWRDWEWLKDTISLAWPADLLVVHGFYGVENDPPSGGVLIASPASGASPQGLRVPIEGLTTTNYE